MQAESPTKNSQISDIPTPKQQLLNLNYLQSSPSPHQCGYCKKQGSISWGLTKDIMHPLTYELMIEKGWRRCGTYYYKPDIKKSCCKLWTHRLDIDMFKIKKDQRKTVRNVAEWLLEKMEGKIGGKEKQKGKEVVEKIKQQGKNKGQEKKQANKQPQKQNPKKQQLPKKKSQKINPEIPQNYTSLSKKLISWLIKKISQQLPSFFSCLVPNLIPSQIPPQQLCHHFQYDFPAEKVKIFLPNSNSSTDQCDFYNNYVMLLYGCNKKLFKKQYACVDFVKDVKGYFEKWSQNIDILEVQIQRSGYLLVLDKNGEKYKKKLEKQKQMLEKQKQKQEKAQLKPIKAQKQENKIKPQKMKPEQPTLSSPTFELCISSTQITFGPLLIQVVPAEVSTDSWRMYQRYCQQIHEKPQKSKSSYSSFLCQKALNFLMQKTDKKCDKKYTPSWQTNPQNPSQSQGQCPKGTRTKLLGCYHMKYYIQKQLIGVGVVDILPHGLSSVYFFYQPKYNNHRLGVFSSLIQIQYIRWLSLSFPQFKYYYMGFYIQNSPKMQYKGNYQNFCLLCPIKYKWVEVNEEIRKKIEKIENDGNLDIVLTEGEGVDGDMVFGDNIGPYIMQNAKFRYDGRELRFRDLNPKIVVTILGMLRDMALVWGKRIFEGFTFTF